MIKTINKNEKASLSEETNLKTSQNEEFIFAKVSVGRFLKNYEDGRVWH